MIVVQVGQELLRRVEHVRLSGTVASSPPARRHLVWLLHSCTRIAVSASAAPPGPGHRIPAGIEQRPGDAYAAGDPGEQDERERGDRPGPVAVPRAAHELDYDQGGDADVDGVGDGEDAEPLEGDHARPLARL
jgi:hypothetical protein